MQARLLHECVSTSSQMTGDEAALSAFWPLLALLGSEHHSRDSLRNCTSTCVILLHGSVSCGLTHDPPKIIHRCRSSKQLMSVTGLVSILYTCIFDIPWHAQPAGALWQCADHDAGQSLPASHNGSCRGCAELRGARAGAWQARKPGRHAAGCKGLLKFPLIGPHKQRIGAQPGLPSCPLLLQQRNHACCIGYYHAAIAPDEST